MNENGDELKQISPLNEKLMYFRVIPETNHIILKTLRDSNKDYTFDEQDEEVWYNSERKEENWTTNEIINAQERSMMINMFSKHWQNAQ